MTQDTMKQDPPGDEKKFCPYCGKELEKEKENATDDKKKSGK